MRTMNAKQVAATLGCSLSTVYRRARAGLLKAVKARFRWVISLDEAALIRAAVRAYRERPASYSPQDLTASGLRSQAAIDTLAAIGGQGALIRDLFNEGYGRVDGFIGGRRVTRVEVAALSARLDAIAA